MNKGRLTWWHLLYYVNLLLNMFRMLIHPSSGACDYFVRYCVGCNLLTWGVLVLCSGIGCGIRVQAEPVVQPALGYHITNSQSRYITPTRLKSTQYSLHNNAPSSRKLLKMDVLTSETCWAVNWHNKASVIKLIYLYSNIKMMRGPIRIRLCTGIDNGEIMTIWEPNTVIIIAEIFLHVDIPAFWDVMQRS